MMTSDAEPIRRRVCFDPTVNLGHLITGSVFLVSTAIGWATMSARIDVTEREIIRTERQAAEAVARTEARFQQDQLRNREDITEVKLLLREINTKLDTKMDKPR